MSLAPLVLVRGIGDVGSAVAHVLFQRGYAAVPSIRRYVILESSSVGLMIMERSSPDQVWQTTVLTNDDTLRMPEIGTEIPVAEIYEGIDFPDQDDTSG